MNNILEFEKPIFELENKLQEMKDLSSVNNIDVTEQIELLEKKIEKLKTDTYRKLTRWQKVQLARHPDRPYTKDYIHAITNKFIELHGDRNFRDDPAIIGGFAEIEKETFLILGHQKGRDVKNRLFRNFGMAHPEGYRKALRLMKIAEKFNKPIITMIDTPGAFPGIEAEERGQAEAIAKNMYEMFLLKVPIICIIIGEGASGGAIGIGVGDRIFMLENTWYSVISPESCSSILWGNWEYKENAAHALKLTAKDMEASHLIDGVIKEPVGGAHKNPKEVAEAIKKIILKEYRKLKKINPDKRVEDRIHKFSQMGIVNREKEKKNKETGEKKIEE